MEAFKPKKILFMHVCQNCEYGKKVFGVGNSPLGYICSFKTGTQKLFGTHRCDEEIEDDDKQISWFDEYKTF